MTEGPPAGYYPDPEQHGTERYWDGTEWTGLRQTLAEARRTRRAANRRGWLIAALVVILCLGIAALISSVVSSSSSSSGPNSCSSTVSIFVSRVDRGPDTIGIDSLRPAPIASVGRDSLDACNGEVAWVTSAIQAGYHDGDFVGDRQAEDLAAALCGVVDRSHETSVCRDPTLHGIDGNP